SIAVTTAWCGVIASARSSTGRSWSLPATAWMARDSVDSSSPKTWLLATKKCPCLSITITSVSATGAAGLSLACGSDTLRWPCCTKVVVSTKNINRVSSTSIRLTTLISNSSALSLPMRMSDRRARHARRTGRGGRGARLDERLARDRKLVQQCCRLLFHLHHVAAHARTEIAVQHVRGNRNDQARRSAHQRLANATGHFHRITDAGHHHRQEHPDQAEYRAEQPQQRSDQRDRAERVEVALQPVHHVAASVLDAFLDFRARTVAHVECGGQHLA